MAQLERERETGSDSGGEFWEAAGIYIRSLVSIHAREGCDFRIVIE